MQDTENTEDTADTSSRPAGTGKGEEIGAKAAGEPKQTARDSTGINPEAEEPIDPEMPKMPAP